MNNFKADKRTILKRISCSEMGKRTIQAKEVYYDLRELKGLWMSVTLCDLNALCKSPELPLMYGIEADILFSLRDSLNSHTPDPAFGIVSIQSEYLLAFKACLIIIQCMLNFLYYHLQKSRSENTEKLSTNQTIKSLDI